jgi:hypothetical protein
VAGATSTGGDSGSTGTTGTTGGTTGTGTTGGTTGTDTTSAGSTGGTTGDALCSTQRCVVYAETDHELYEIDPAHPDSTTKLCTFGGALTSSTADSVNDIAVQRDGALYGITRTDLYRIDPATCAATHVVQMASSGFNCLAFDGQGHLIAATQTGDVSLIDVGTGAVTAAGRFGGTLGCSGDLVTLSNGLVYATAKDSSCTSNCTDLLVTLDPSNGYQATTVGDIGSAGVFGLGFWGGVLYGFTKNGESIQIDPASGAGTTLGVQATLKFYGAGTTPLAPILR